MGVCSSMFCFLYYTQQQMPLANLDLATIIVFDSKPYKYAE